MAQIAPDISSDAPRALPRRGRAPALKTLRQRFMPVDALWIVLLAALSFGAAYASMGHVSNALSSGLIAGNVALVYLLGWRTRDRATGVIAALFLATSLPFVSHIGIGNTALLLTLLTTCAFFAFAAGSSLIAVILVGAAALLRLDAVLLGLLLIALSLAQRRQQAILSLGLFLVIVISGWTALIVFSHQKLAAPIFHPQAWLTAWLISPGMIFLTWFLIPFCSELSEASRRSRWLPIFFWAILSTAVGSFVIFGNRAATLTPLMPIFFLLAAGGVARLLPTLAGEFPAPALRYLIAALAILGLVGIRFRLEKPILRPHIISQPQIAAPISVPVSLIAPAPIIHTAVKSTALIKPKLKIITNSQPASKPAVRLFVTRSSH